MRQFKGREPSPRYGLVDLQTGEVVANLTPPRKMGAHWMRLFKDTKLDLLKRYPDLKGESYRVLHYLEAATAWDNEVPGPSKFAAALGMQRQNVGRAYKELCDAEFLVKVDGRFYLSPLVGWQGTERQFEDACVKLLRPPQVKVMELLR